MLISYKYTLNRLTNFKEMKMLKTKIQVMKTLQTGSLSNVAIQKYFLSSELYSVSDFEEVPLCKLF